jgi:hypothetical protein
MDFEKIGIVIIILGVVGSSWLDDIRISNMEKKLTKAIYKYAVSEANATKERVYNDMTKDIEREHNETVNTLDDNDIIDFGD